MNAPFHDPSSHLMSGLLQSWQSMLSQFRPIATDAQPVQPKMFGIDLFLPPANLPELLQRLQNISNSLAGMFGLLPAQLPEAGSDKRFSADVWRDDPHFDFLHRSYLAYSDLLQRSVEAAPVNEKTKGQMRFAMRQALDALSPANFFATNPEAIQLALSTRGESLKVGIALFLQDLAKGRVTMTDETAFEVGKNIAVSEGQVIYENELIQLIQYVPTTNRVGQRPLVIIPPCINKFYILDLQQENSFVRFAVAQGHTVFLASWRNVTRELSHLTWDDYLEQGVIQAIDIAREISGEDQVNALGFCVGGTLLASAIGVMNARATPRVASLTLLTTMLDFHDTGEIGLLIDERSVVHRERALGAGGVLHGKELAATFSALRANELIWSYVVNSYLKGKSPPAFDLLYWNSDMTNLPGPMYTWYVRKTYLENLLREPGGTVQCGVPVDLSTIDVPAYLYASREDHIVPWRTAYSSSQMLSGENTFVLGASGHIAGVVNSPSNNKRNYWIGEHLHEDPEKWLSTARSVPGSWWMHWHDWLKPHAGSDIPARKKLGSKRYRPIEPAPGRYVKQRA